MSYWDDIADRNAQECEINEKKFYLKYGERPEKVNQEINLIRDQETKFYFAYSMIAIGTASAAGPSGDGR